MIRRGTVIYGDSRIGDHFQAGYNSVVRALVKIGDYCTLMNQSTIEGIVRFGTGVRVMSMCTYRPARGWGTMSSSDRGSRLPMTGFRDASSRCRRLAGRLSRTT